MDMLIDKGKRLEAGVINRATVLSESHTHVHTHTHTHTHTHKCVHTHIGLYDRGLVYFNIPIADSDIIVVPPLQGFVMNRVQGDYFETLLYKIFVSIDEHTSIAELANVLQIDPDLVKVGGQVLKNLLYPPSTWGVGQSNLYQLACLK